MLCDHTEGIHGSLQKHVGDSDANRRLDRQIGVTNSRAHIQKQDSVLVAKAVQCLPYELRDSVTADFFEIQLSCSEVGCNGGREKGWGRHWGQFEGGEC